MAAAQGLKATHDIEVCIGGGYTPRSLRKFKHSER
jgi:hypothetical protein